MSQEILEKVCSIVSEQLSVEAAEIQKQIQIFRMIWVQIL